MADKSLDLASRVSVQLTITVEARSSWGVGTTIEQVYDQAARETEGAIRTRLRAAGFQCVIDTEKTTVLTFVRQSGNAANG